MHEVVFLDAEIADHAKSHAMRQYLPTYLFECTGHCHPHVVLTYHVLLLGSPTQITSNFWVVLPRSCLLSRWSHP